MIEMCSIDMRECEGICPKKRIERKQESICPALFYKEAEEKKFQKLHQRYNEDEQEEE